MSRRGGMIGRVYRWRDEHWRVLARWKTLNAQDSYTFVAPCCGHVLLSSLAADPDEIVGEDSYCGSCGEMWTERHSAGHHCLNGWQPGGRPVVRNVLIENAVTGERVTRPFRGLRKIPDHEA